MHEEALLRDLIRRVDKVAAEAGADRVRCVRVWVGALSHVPEPWLRGEWGRRTQGSRASGSRLEVELSEDIGSPRALSLVLVSVDVGAATTRPGDPEPAGDAPG